jgi:hypothetical protein
MDFVSRHPALKRRSAEARRYAEIYQDLGLAWEFLALQCKHAGGWRKLRDGKFACKICGYIRGVQESWVLLPREGAKKIGRRTVPGSGYTFPNRKAATLVNDTIDFHGTKLNVEVLNEHRSTSRWLRGRDWTIAADRMVRLTEGGTEIRFDSYIIGVTLKQHRRGEMPPYSHFVSELPRKFLKKFPVMLQFDKRGRFTGLLIFTAEAGKRTPRKQKQS